MTLKRILLPVDFSESSQLCLSTAVALARSNDAELFLLHVEEPQPVITAGGGVAAYPIPLPATEELEAQLKAIDPGENARCSRHMVLGTASSEIVKFADESYIDMIVMGTHGRTGLSRLLMGSVAEAVVRKAPCPVLTLKQPMDEAVTL
ncbi:MAG: universal stress protein [Planctomycetaceae bacterium]|nr:universal stress protein [Planctomycetales bacterium]MCB9875702.1 universal stress protein [Planctomycetaceae bacterium]